MRWYKAASIGETNFVLRKENNNDHTITVLKCQHQKLNFFTDIFHFII